MQCMSAVKPVPVGCLSICVVQIERQVSHCSCPKRYQVSKVAEGKYRVSGEGGEGEAEFKRSSMAVHSHIPRIKPSLTLTLT